MESQIIKLLSDEIDVVCILCKNTIFENMVLTTCCHKLFHKKCIDNYQVHHCLCPNCDKPYLYRDTDLRAELISYGYVSYDKLTELYAMILKNEGIDVLYELEKRIKNKYLEYNNRYKGYFPLSKIEPLTNNNTNKRFKVETYGLFEGFNWDNFIMCGAFLAKIIANKKDTQDPLYFILYSRNYNLIRDRLSYFCKFIKRRFLIDKEQLIPVTVKKNRIEFYIPGFERGIVLFINMFDSLTTIMSRLDYYTNGVFYNGSYNITIPGLKGISSGNFCKKPMLQHMLPYDQCLKTFQSLNKELNLIDTDILCDKVYGQYKLHIHLNKSTEGIYHLLRKNTTLLQNIKVDFNNSEPEKYKIYIMTPYGIQYNFDKLISNANANANVFKKFIDDIIYADRTVE